MHEQKREAVPKHSLPPQEQILSYVGRFINCPYGTPEYASRYFFIKEGGKTSLPEALAALQSVLSAFLMLQRVEVLQKEVPFAQCECGKKKPACVYTGTHAGLDKRCYRQVTIPVDALRS